MKEKEMIANTKEKKKHIKKSGYKCLTRDDRIRIEAWYNDGVKKAEIARRLGVNRSTITYEIKKGLYVHLVDGWKEEIRYSSDKAQQVTELNCSVRGRKLLKIEEEKGLAEYLEKKILFEKRSPKTALADAKKDGFKKIVCFKTIYNLIDMDFFLYLTNEALPIKRNKKGKRSKKTIKRLNTNEKLITERPKQVDSRETFGHWEMDTVKGKQKVTKSCLLVLTERKTRDEVVIKLPDQKSESVVEALNKLEYRFGKDFKKIFRSITVDNGPEFADGKGIRKSIYGSEEDRVELYYCHPYASWERGSNENNNRLIRRHYPKGTDLDKISEEDIQFVEDWINDYPREIFDFKTSREMFNEELRKLGIAA